MQHGRCKVPALNSCPSLPACRGTAAGCPALSVHRSLFTPLLPAAPRSRSLSTWRRPKRSTPAASTCVPWTDLCASTTPTSSGVAEGRVLGPCSHCTGRLGPGLHAALIVMPPPSLWYAATTDVWRCHSLVQRAAGQGDAGWRQQVGPVPGGQRRGGPGRQAATLA